MQITADWSNIDREPSPNSCSTRGRSYTPPLPPSYKNGEEKNGRMLNTTKPTKHIHVTTINIHECYIVTHAHLII